MNDFLKIGKTKVELRNIALKYSLEFGQNWGQPIDKRMKLKYNLITDEEIGKLQKIYDEVQKNCWGIIHEVTGLLAVDQTIFCDKLINLINNKYNWIDHENREKIINQFCYYARKDGAIK